MDNIDSLIWAAGDRNESELRRVSGGTVERLAAALCTELREVGEVDVRPPNFFRVEIETARPLGGRLLHLAVRGIVFGEEQPDGNGMEVGAFLFLYVEEDSRLMLKTGESYVTLRYRRTDDDRGDWNIVDWYSDEYGEFDQW